MLRERVDRTRSSFGRRKCRELKFMGTFSTSCAYFFFSLFFSRFLEHVERA